MFESVQILFFSILGLTALLAGVAAFQLGQEFPEVVSPEEQEQSDRRAHAAETIFFVGGGVALAMAAFSLFKKR